MNESQYRPGIFRQMIERFTGNKRKSVLNSRDIDELVDRLNALSQVRIVPSTKNRATLGQQNLTLEINVPEQVVQSTSGAEIAWFQITTRNIDPDIVQGIQVDAFNQKPDPITLKLLPLVSQLEQVPTYIAKQSDMRRSIMAEMHGGIKLTYTTPVGGDVDNNRVSTDGTNPQFENVYPPYVQQSEISALYANTGTGFVPPYGQSYILCCKPTAGTGTFYLKPGSDPKLAASYLAVEWQEIGPWREWVSEG